eukprot:6200882-Pleurochrysis_carterae.AAC.1
MHHISMSCFCSARIAQSPSEAVDSSAQKECSRNLVDRSTTSYRAIAAQFPWPRSLIAVVIFVHSRL